MPWLIVGLILLIVVYAGLRWISESDPKTVRYGMMLIGMVALLLLSFFLILTGRAVVSWPFILGAAGLYLRLSQAIGIWTLLQRFFGKKRPSGKGRTSTVTTSHLRMMLDHASASLNGEILEGAYKGRFLNDLSRTEILDKLLELRQVDAEGARLLESYLDKLHAGWHEDVSGSGHQRDMSGPTSSMTRKEALQILGLEVDANEKQVRSAHKDLMRKLHPDAGGSSYLASKINQAKDILLGK